MAGRRKNLLSRFQAYTQTSSAAAETNSSSLSASPTAQQQLFSPQLIFSQIVALQSLHYLVLSILQQINHVFFGTSITVDRIFTAEYLNLWSWNGWLDNSSVLISNIFGAFLLALIVEKSRKCLDFAVTLFTVHFLLCCFYNGFPISWDWWILNIFGMILMTVLGEYLCSRVELQEIPLL